MLLSITKRTRYFARLILLIGMLASLCLSSGEGIRLLPFPASGVASASAEVLPGALRQTYAPSVHHSRNGLRRPVKPKKTHKGNSTSEAVTNSNGILFTLLVRRLKRADLCFYHTLQPLRASLADRAPPAS